MTNLEIAWPHPVQIPQNLEPSTIREGKRHDPRPKEKPLSLEELADERKARYKAYQREYWKKRVLGELAPSVIKRRERHDAIVSLLKKKHSLTPGEIHCEIGGNYNTIKGMVARMYKAGVIDRIKGTWGYCLAARKNHLIVATDPLESLGCARAEP